MTIGILQNRLTDLLLKANLRCALSFCTSACQQTPTAQSILPEHTLLKAGDVVFRQGNGLTSRAVRAADSDGRFSHIGIVADSAGALRIIHAVPDEPDFPGDPDRVKMETPERFFNAIHASCGKVMRPAKWRCGTGGSSQGLRGV